MAALNYVVMNAGILDAAIAKLGLPPPTQKTIPAKAIALKRHFADVEKGMADQPGVELLKCSNCKGESTEDLDACPYCGDIETNVGTANAPAPAPAPAPADTTPADAPAPAPAEPEEPEPDGICDWPGLCERLAETNQDTRHATGITELDALLRGGLPAGKLLVIGGEPGAGKTMLGAQVARHMARAGAYVVFLEPDDPGGFDTRWLMSAGASRAEVDARSPHAKAEAQRLAREPIKVAPARTTLAEAEKVLGRLAERYPSRQLVLVVDSLQKVKNVEDCDGGDDDNPRTRVDAAVEKLKGIRQDYDAIVIATSEVARAAYGSKQAFRNVRGLAAFKESGSIEYGATVAIVLHKGASGEVEAEVCKNKLGPTASLTLRLGSDRATFEGVEPAAEEEPEALDARVFAAIEANPSKSGKALLKLVKGDRNAFYEALDRLRDSGQVVNVGTKTWAKYLTSDAYKAERSERSGVV